MNTEKQSGWTKEESDLLARETKNAAAEHLPLKTAFDRVAEKTGRRSGSVRNYYYTAFRKENGIASRRTFETFDAEEIDSMLRFMLRALGEGKSVRRAAMECGGGDQSAMLRYQNKFRSILKNHPEEIRRIAEELKQEGLPAADPTELLPAPTDADQIQTKKAFSALWNRLEKRALELPAQTAATFVEGIAALLDAVRCEDAGRLLAENETLRRENEGLLRQLAMVETPFDGDMHSPIDKGTLLHPFGPFRDYGAEERKG